MAMVFILVMSLIGALIESASIQMTKDRKRADMLLALENVFAEYDRKVLDEYDLFVRSGCDESVLKKRLTYYGITDEGYSITKQERLTDHNGSPFREQAVRYMKDWLGLSGDSQEGGNVIDSDGLPDTDSISQVERSVETELEELLSQEESGLPEENNPISSVQRLKNTNLITLVAEHPEQISGQSIQTEALPSKRTLFEGNWGSHSGENTVDKGFFVAYLTAHYGNFADAKEDRALLYEQEYLLGGYESDKENLESVCEDLLKLRMAANYAYLMADTAKQTEAEALALTLCSLLTVPGVTKLVKHAVLLAWAYGESVVDVRVLLKGKCVAPVKTKDTWQLQLANLAKLGTAEEQVGEVDASGGWNYQKYLTGLLFLKDKDTLSMRALDLMESHLQIRTDECVTKIEIFSHVTLRKGVKDKFSTMFQYE